MKITLAMVISVDGKSTNGDLPDQSWASDEDKTHLSKLISEHDTILMGGKTYESAKSHIKPKEGKLRIVVTRDPLKFEDDEIAGQLEFTNEEPEDVVASLEARSYKKILLLSGENLNKEFFEKKLINELILTVEPLIFGSGKSITSLLNKTVNLKLRSFEKANDKGTLFLTYEVLY